MKKIIIGLILLGVLLIGLVAFVAGAVIKNIIIPEGIGSKYPVIEQQLAKSEGDIDNVFMPFDYACIVMQDILITCDKDVCKIPRGEFINIKCTDQKG